MDPCAASEDGEEVVWVEEQSDEGSFVIVKTEDLMDDEAAEEDAGKGKKNGTAKTEEKTKEDVQEKAEENGTTTAPAPMKMQDRLTAQRPSITISDQSGPSKPSLEENEEEEVEETVKLLGGRPQDRILLPDEISQLSVNESEESEQEEEVPNTGSLLAGAAEKMAAQDWAQKAAKEEAAAAKAGKDEQVKNGLGEGGGREESAEVATTLFLQPKDSAGTNEGVEAKVEEAKVEEKGEEPELPRPAAVEADIPTLVFPSTAPPNVVAWLGLDDKQQQQPSSKASSEELKCPEEEEKEKTSPALGMAVEEEAPCRLKIISMDTQKERNGQKEEEDADQKDADQKSSANAEEKEAEDASSKSSQPGLRLVAIEQRLVEEEPAGNRRKSQEEEEKEAEKNRKRRAEERAVQFVVQLPAVNKATEESEEIPQEDEGEKEDAESKTEAKEEAKEDEAASASSKSSRGAQGVRFADSQNSAAETAAAANSMMMPAAAAAAGDAESSEELAQLDEVEQKMRRKSKEALDLVDRIFGLQAKEAEKKPPIQRPTPLTSAGSEEQSKSAVDSSSSRASASAGATASDNSSASSASTAVPTTEQEQLKEALAAGVHGLAGTSAATSSSSSSSSAKAATIGENVFQIGEGPVLDVETVSVNASLLQEPSDCLLLPGQLLLIVDADAGLSLVSLQSKQLQAQLSPRAGVWRNAECACLGGPDGDQVYVLLEYNVNNSEEQADKQAASTEAGQEAKNDAAAEGREVQAVQQGEAVQQGQAVPGGQQPKEQPESSSESQQTGTTTSTAPNGGAGQPKGILKRGLQAQQQQPTAQPPPGTMDSQQQQQRRSCEPDWRRFICRFSVPGLRMLDRIEAPKWLRERVVWQCRLCWVPSTQCLYLVANTPNQGFLFELRCPQGRWAECKGTRMHSQYADMHHFAVVGPVTELLLLETNRCYVQLLSVYNSTCVQARTLGLCERPGALCVDELGNLLIFDRATSTVGLFSRAYLEKVGDLCLVERAHCQLSARGGLLAVLCRPTRELKLHRYGDRLRAIEQRWLNGGEEPAPTASQTQQQRQGVGAAGDDDQ